MQEHSCKGGHDNGKGNGYAKAKNKIADMITDNLIGNGVSLHLGLAIESNSSRKSWSKIEIY